MQLSFELDPSPLTPAVFERLISAFGAFDGPRLDPLDQLIKSMISSRTYDEVSWPAFLRLREAFQPWDRLIDAEPVQIEAVIAAVAHAELKAAWLPQALKAIRDQRGSLDLSFLNQGSVEEDMAWLQRLPGVGTMVAAAVLSFSTLRRRAMVVDTHVWRVARRIGLAPGRADPDAVQRALMDAAPASWEADDFYNLHWLLKTLGQTLCEDSRTRCGGCPAAPLCATRAKSPPTEGQRVVPFGRSPRAEAPEPSPDSNFPARPLPPALQKLKTWMGRKLAPVASLGRAPLDEALGGGLSPGSHQAAGETAGDGAAALGFAAAVMVRALDAQPGSKGLLVRSGEAAREDGVAHGPGLQALGLDPDRVGVVSVRTGAEALRVVDEALRSGAVTAVLAALWDEPQLDLSVTRRFNLSAARCGALAILATRDLSATSAALTRWRVRALPSRESRRRLGRPAFKLDLVRNRHGAVGEWILEWNSDERRFQPPAALPPVSLSGPVVRPAGDRSRPAFPAESSRAEAAQRSPLVLFEKQANALRLVALDAAAQAEGLSPGLMLTDARAQVPNLRALEAEPTADAAWLAAAAEACRRYTPALALDPPDGLMLNVTGAAGLFGGEPGLVELIEDRFGAKGFSLRCGLADTPGLAWAMARFSDRVIAEPGEREDILKPLPVEALGLSGEAAHVLRRLGLRTVGQLMSGPRAPLAKRLGEETLERLDQVLGRRASALDLKLEISPYLAERRLAEPMTAAEEIVIRVRQLAARLGARLEGEGLGARGYRIELHRLDGAIKRLEVWASLPLRAPARVAALFAERIEALNEGLEADYGFDLIRLEALRPQAVTQRTQSLLPDADEGEAKFAALVDQLSARLGPGAVRRLTPAPHTRLPEGSVRALPFDPAAPAAWTGEAPRDEGSPLRPLTLFDPPQSIEVIAEAPEQPPARFTWRRVQHMIAAAEGPERIDPEWGRATRRRVRDYYRLEDEDGRRFWVFREGRYTGEADQDEAPKPEPTAPPRWFLHGLFA